MSKRSLQWQLTPHFIGSERTRTTIHGKRESKLLSRDRRDNYYNSGCDQPCWLQESRKVQGHQGLQLRSSVHFIVPINPKLKYYVPSKIPWFRWMSWSAVLTSLLFIIVMSLYQGIWSKVLQLVSAHILFFATAGTNAALPMQPFEGIMSLPKRILNRLSQTR